MPPDERWKSATVVVAVVLAATIGVGAFQLVREQHSIDSLRSTTSARSLTLARVQQDANRAESDAQDALNEIQALPAGNTGNTGNTGASYEISQLQSMLSQAQQLANDADSSVSCVIQYATQPLLWQSTCGG